MKVRYVWFDDPDTEKVVDFDQLYEFDKCYHKMLGVSIERQEYTEWQLKLLAEKKERGLVLSYEVIEGSETDGEIPEPRGNA